MMGDSCRQVSWLAAQARRSRLPAPGVKGSGIWGDARRLQLRGQPRLGEETSLTAFPFHLPPPEKGCDRDRHASTTKQATPTLVNRLIESAIEFASALPKRQPNAVHRRFRHVLAVGTVVPGKNLDEICPAGFC